MKRVVAIAGLAASLLLACAPPAPSPEERARLALERALTDPDRGVRYAAVDALGKAGAAPALLATALEDDAWCVRREAGWWLRRRGVDARSPLETVLGAGSSPTRATAARALAGTGADGVPLLRRALADPDGEVRLEALGALRRIGVPAAASAAQAVAEHLDAPEHEEQVEAALTLVTLDPDPPETAMAMLAAEVRKPRILGTYEAINALARAGMRGREALCTIQAERAPNDRLHGRIGSRLRWVDGEKANAGAAPRPTLTLPPPESLPARPSPPAPALPALLRRLADPERDTRIAAAAALGDVESWSAAVEPALVRALADENWRVRRAAITALGARRKAAERLAPFLADPILPLSHAAAEGLAHGGAAAAQPVADQVATGHYGVLHYAPIVFEQLGAAGAAAVDTFTELLTHPDVNVRECAARCLQPLGPHARTAAAALVEALGDDRLCVVSHAALALGAIGVSEEGLAALGAESARVRAYAAFALGWALGQERDVDQVPFEPRLPVEHVAPPDGYEASGIWDPDFATAFAAAKTRTYTDLTPVEAERTMELLLPEGQRRGCGVDFEELRSTIGSAELPAFVRYLTRARRTRPERTMLYSPLHRIARWDHIPALLWFRRVEEADVLEGFYEIEMPLDYTSAFARERARDLTGTDPGPRRRDLLRALLHHFLQDPEGGLHLPERWLLNDYEPEDADAPLLAVAQSLEAESERTSGFGGRWATLRALGRCRDEASRAYLAAAAGVGDETALGALAALARRGDRAAAAELEERSLHDGDALLFLLEVLPDRRTRILASRLGDPDTAHPLLNAMADWPARVTWLGIEWTEATFLGLEPALAANPPAPDVLARVVVEVPLCSTKRLGALLFAASEASDAPPWWDDAEGGSVVGGLPYRVLAFLHSVNAERLRALVAHWAASDDEDVRDWAREALILLGDASNAPLLLEWLRTAELDIPLSILGRLNDPALRLVLAEISRTERFDAYDRTDALDTLAILQGWPVFLPPDPLQWVPDMAQETARRAIREDAMDELLATSYWPTLLDDLSAYPEMAPVWERVTRRALAGDAHERAEIWSAFRAGRYRWTHNDVTFALHTLGGDLSTLPHWTADLDANCCRVSDGLASTVFEAPYGIEDLYGSEKNGVGQPLSRRVRTELGLSGGRWVPSPLLDSWSPPGRISVFVPEPE